MEPLLLACLLLVSSARAGDALRQTQERVQALKRLPQVPSADAPSPGGGLRLEENVDSPYWILLDIPTQRFAVRVVTAKKVMKHTSWARLPDMAAGEPTAVAGMNGGYFGGTPALPVGLLVADGKDVYSEPVDPAGKETLNAVFFVRADGSADIAPLSEFLELRRKGGSSIVSAVIGKSKGDSANEASRDERAAVCTKPGHVMMVLAKSQTLEGMGALLKNAGCEKFVHLDGGGSSQMFVRAGASPAIKPFEMGWERKNLADGAECSPPRDSYAPTCFRRVMDFLLVVPLGAE